MTTPNINLSVIFLCLGVTTPIFHIQFRDTLEIFRVIFFFIYVYIYTGSTKILTKSPLYW